MIQSRSPRSQIRPRRRSPPPDWRWPGAASPAASPAFEVEVW